MTITKTYQQTLDQIRQNSALLDQYRFDRDASDSKHFDRLRLNIAMYNDLRQTDFEIAKFLFEQEKEWRKVVVDEGVDNLYFSAFLLSLFNNPAVVWQFLETKYIDFDSSIGFDGQFLLAAGIETTYQYLETVDHPDKERLLKYIGQNAQSCFYTQKEIDDWKANKIDYFQDYQYPIENEIDFFYLTNEKQLFLEALPGWINAQETWTRDNSLTYNMYAEYAGDVLMQIEATKRVIENSNNDIADYYRKDLAALYINNANYDKALDILTELISRTDRKNIVRDYLEQLCRIVLADKTASNPITIKAYEIMKREQDKYGDFHTTVDNLIREADGIFDGV